METISAALSLVDSKKENLRKAFEDLQSHSSSLSSFNLSWFDLDSHFSALQSSLQTQFTLLQSQQQKPQSQLPKQPPNQTQQPDSLVSVRPELKAFCENMDGLGLRNYIAERRNERATIRAELPDALRLAPDSAAMVLDATEGFYVKKSVLYDLRRSCVVLLEELMGLKPKIGGEVKERARNLADEWKGRVGSDGENPLEAFGFLLLLGTYGLADGFSVEELVDFVVIAASKGKQDLAVKFIFGFELADKFPPVTLLKNYVEESKKLAKKVRKDGKFSLQSKNEAVTKEVNALKSVIEIIEYHKLESELPKENLKNRIEALEKQKAERKQQSKLKNLSGSKRPWTTELAGPEVIPKSIAGSTVPAFQQSHLQPSGLLPDHHAPYSSSPAGPYGLAGPTSGTAQYAGPSAGSYGPAGAPFGVPGNLMPTQPHTYPSEPHMPSGYFDRPIAYGGYGLPPQYHPSYYPQ
ncbi:hypothetical protein HYC85_011471 [Camellia sinensis]|uniref:FRIGIDA-like protein n=1 Tax=Camellia sinensis TaxID=4442 RepID=A0A7J7HC95_CAMSI|nr:hypothetical protein HYC85_011471 [Camellia sinensis]